MAMRALIVTAALLFTLQTNAAGLSSVTIQSQGSGPSRDAAINAAIVEAISQVNGAQVASTISTSMRESFSESDGGSSYESTSEMQEQISKATSGVVQSWSIVSVGPDTQLDGFWLAVLNVEVAQYKQSKQLERLRMAIGNFWFRSGGADDYDLSAFAKAFARELENLLTQSRKFAMLDRSFLADQQQELDLVASGGSPTQELARLGQRAGTDYLIVGEVTEAAKSSKKRTLQTTGQEVTIKSASGSVDYRLIDVATSQVKFAETQAGQVDSLSIGGAARMAAKAAAESIINAIYPITVIGFDGQNFNLNQGGGLLTAGDTYHLVLLGDTLRDPYTKERLGRSEKKIGLLKISDVQAKSASAEIVSIDIDLNPSDALPAMILRPATKASDQMSAQKQLEKAKEEGSKQINKILEDSDEDW